ncbi:MAG: alkyl hydroperoxide reductase [Crocinitomicaceae bacterium]|nr:alkyl hydroperoxide reductase [Crocinitomicaceae bacterium]|tara:strand:+ start:4110 stop:4649 length:540 start_codon:yes stop_codon:yes gene_type:complete
MKTVNDCNGLMIGDKVKDFSSIDQNGDKIQLSDLLKKGKVVIVFYRGQWCPVCKPHLKKLQNSLEEIKNKRATILLITPEKQENIKKTILKTNITIPVLYDNDYKIMEQFDLAFLPSKGLRIMYNSLLMANLKNAQSDDSQTLPVPATYVIEQDGTVKWRHFDRNYAKRANTRDILNQL